jgi:hypothetical protein
MSELLLDRAGRRRSPATLPGFGITSVYLQGIDSGEIIETVHARRAPTTPVSASLRLSSTAQRGRCSSR